MKQYKSTIIIAIAAFTASMSNASTLNTIETDGNYEAPEEQSLVQSATKEISVVSDNDVSGKEDRIFEVVEQPAQFPGGQSGLSTWLAQNLRYPEQAMDNDIEGKVIVKFTVEKDGTITNPVIARGVDKDLDKEAIRIVKKMPKWVPGRNNGVPVRSKFTLPVAFKLQH